MQYNPEHYRPATAVDNRPCFACRPDSKAPMRTITRHNVPCQGPPVPGDKEGYLREEILCAHCSRLITKRYLPLKRVLAEPLQHSALVQQPHQQQATAQRGSAIGKPPLMQETAHGASHCRPASAPRQNTRTTRNPPLPSAARGRPRSVRGRGTVTKESSSSEVSCTCPLLTSGQRAEADAVKPRAAAAPSPYRTKPFPLEEQIVREEVVRSLSNEPRRVGKSLQQMQQYGGRAPNTLTTTQQTFTPWQFQAGAESSALSPAMASPHGRARSASPVKSVRRTVAPAPGAGAGSGRVVNTPRKREDLSRGDSDHEAACPCHPCNAECTVAPPPRQFYHSPEYKRQQAVFRSRSSNGVAPGSVPFVSRYAVKTRSTLPAQNKAPCREVEVHVVRGREAQQRNRCPTRHHVEMHARPAAPSHYDYDQAAAAEAQLQNRSMSGERGAARPGSSGAGGHWTAQRAPTRPCGRHADPHSAVDGPRTAVQTSTHPSTQVGGSADADAVARGDISGAAVYALGDATAHVSHEPRPERLCDRCSRDGNAMATGTNADTTNTNNVAALADTGASASRPDASMLATAAKTEATVTTGEEPTLLRSAAPVPPVHEDDVRAACVKERKFMTPRGRRMVRVPVPVETMYDTIYRGVWDQ